MREVILIVWLCALTAPILSAQAPNCSQWNTKAFFRAATVDDVTTCLSASADPMARDKEGVRPLHWTAALSRDPSVVEVLLKAGADPNAQDDTKNTPLHLAAGYNEDPAAVKLLLAAGRDGDLVRPLFREAGTGEGNTEVGLGWRQEDSEEHRIPQRWPDARQLGPALPGRTR